MCDNQLEQLLKEHPILSRAAAGEEVLWINPGLRPAYQVLSGLQPERADIVGAGDRLERFAPFLQLCFPETIPQGGLIESPLTPIPAMQHWLEERFGAEIPGRLLLKQDNELAIAGSVKARGGIYEVLYRTEVMALASGVVAPQESYAKLAGQKARDFFHKYTIQVGSTGNLGLSIGIAAAAIGYHVIVHMSADAKQWKKDLLREKGAEVIEYASDYGEAVRQGRAKSDADPYSYFVDDENSQTLFLGYAVAAPRLRDQLEQMNIPVDPDHPLLVTIPCGVGGAPGGISFGLKHFFRDSVHCFFVEPTQAPCMLAGMVTGLHSQISVQDLGLSGRTEADGLAVGRPSGFVGKVMAHLLSGEMTVEDHRLYAYLRGIMDSEGIFLEPSACAGFHGPVQLLKCPEGREYAAANGLTPERLKNSTHIVWATGGSLVPQAVREEYLGKC